MATLTIKTLDRTGLDVTVADAAADVGGDEFANDGSRTFYSVNNGSGSPVTVTFVTPVTVDGLAVADRDVVVAAGSTSLIGPFPRSDYNDANNMVQVTYSAVTTVTVVAAKLAKD